MLSLRDHRLESLVHRGSTSEVWLATRVGPLGFEAPVALKTLVEARAASQGDVRAFAEEARAASAVQHHNVVQTRELLLDHGRYWMSMERVRGWSLRELLSAVAASGEQIPIPIALSLARDAATGLQAIHDAGLVHGGIASENLMIASAGRLQIHDFGSATRERAATDDGAAAGGSEARTSAGGRADVFNLGLVLEELIPGREGAPVGLDAIVRRAADPDSRRRFASALALEVSLDLVSLREGWLVTPSYVAAYLRDVLRMAGPQPLASRGLVARPPAPSAELADEDSDALTPRPEGIAEDQDPTISRRIRAPSRRHLVGVGAPSPADRIRPGPGFGAAVRDDELARRPRESREAGSSTVRRARDRRW